MMSRVSAPFALKSTAGTMLLVAGGLLVWPACQGKVASGRPGPARVAGSEITEGSLVRLMPPDEPGGQLCPLKHTAVTAEISGYVARVTVEQLFDNPLNEKIEAVYVFPLPADSAVDDMQIEVAGRTIRAAIKKREEAREIYERARRQGHVAALLDQERPNVFTQSVANIPPLQQVKVRISYVQTLGYDEGAYEFSFPMVVGPRYIPGAPVGKQGGGWAPDTDKVPDASRITPPVTPPGTRAGHDVSLELRLDAGVPVTDLRSRSHEVVTERSGAGKAVIRLAKRAVIPNKDFVLEYGVAGPQLSDALLTHHDARGGFFTLVLQPPRRVTIEDVTPKELVFVLDTSGSMQGFPIEKAKETMKLALDGLYPRDTFNLITFSGDTHVLFPEPVPATPENLAHAQSFLASRRGAGGTEMMKAIRAALAPSSEGESHVRIVCFMTDGYVGNDMEIIAEIRKHSGARVFSFGIGGAVNRFLLDKMAEEGRGEVTYVGLKDDGSAAARRFHERVRNPLLTDISVDWGGLAVSEVYPQRIQDLFSAKPVILHGRYGRPGSGKITLRGRMSGQPFSRTLNVDLPAKAPQHDVLATLWARKHIDHLMSQDWAGVQHRNLAPALQEEITRLGLDFRLMTQFTSFVAVEDRIVTEGGEPRRIEVPVEMPEGVSYEGVFGISGEAKVELAGNVAAPMAFRQMSKVSVDEQEPDKRGYSHQPSGPLPPIRVDTPPASGGPQTAGDKAAGFRSKFHPDVLKVVDSSRQGAPAVSAPFVSEGKARVEVWLADAAPDTIAQIRALGFETTQDSKVAKILIGRIEVRKLEALARLEKVRYIAPHRELGAGAFSADPLEATSPPALLVLGGKPDSTGAGGGSSCRKRLCGEEFRRVLLLALQCAVCAMLLPPRSFDTCPHRQEQAGGFRHQTLLH